MTRFSRVLLLVSGFSLAGAGWGNSAYISGMAPQELAGAVAVAKADGVGAGYCGRGVWSVLKGIGYGGGLRSANGQDWELNLSEAGWIPLVCRDPNRAPLGSILVYSSDIRRHGRNLVGTKGGLWGHVELVSAQEGRKVFVSDKARERPGGTVADNFTGRAWVPPGSVPVIVPGSLVPSSYDPAVVRKGAQELLSDRLSQARAYFSEFSTAGL